MSFLSLGILRNIIFVNGAHTWKKEEKIINIIIIILAIDLEDITFGQYVVYNRLLKGVHPIVFVSNIFPNSSPF